MASVDADKEATMFGALVEPPHVSLCLSNMSKMVNAITLDLPDIFSFNDFDIILYT